MPSGRPVSQDAVDMVRHMHEVHKLSYSKIGELIGRPKNYIHRLLDKCDPVTGERILAKQGRRQKTDTEENERIREFALANPYIGCDALTKMYNSTVTDDSKKLSKSSVHRRLKAVGLQIVKCPVTAETEDKKSHPKSRCVYRFQAIPEKKKRKKKIGVLDDLGFAQQEPADPAYQPMIVPVSSQFIYPTVAVPVPSSIVPPEIAELNQTSEIQIIVYPPGRPAVQLQ